MILSFLLGLVLAANTPAQANRQAGPATGPITIEVGESATVTGGLLDLLLPTRDDDVMAAERELASELGDRPWLQVARDRADAAVAVNRCTRSVSSRGRSKDGTKVTITFRYAASAGIATRGDRGTIEAETLVTQSYPEGSYRRNPSKAEDHEAFRRVGRELAGKVREWLLPHVAALRPDGPDAGFEHRTRSKLLIKGDGLEVTEVAAGGPADRSGLKVGDRIRKVDNEGNTSKMDERVRTWHLAPPGTRVAIEIERERQRQTVEVVLERPRHAGSPRR
jgi:hypothetical protein